MFSGLCAFDRLLRVKRMRRTDVDDIQLGVCQYPGIVMIHLEGQTKLPFEVCRGRRQKENQDGLIPYIIEQEENSKEYRKNWARLIQKIYEVDPLACPKCQGKISIISFIENEEVIRRILEHLGLWLVKRRPQPRANAPPVQIHLDYSRRGVGPSGPEADSQIPSFEKDVHKDPDYPIETYAP
jgi:hypothetical protein